MSRSSGVPGIPGVPVRNLFGYVGRMFITFLQDLSGIYHLFAETVHQTGLLFADRKRLKKARILSYVDAIGSFSVPLVLLVSVLIGIALTVVVAFNLDDLGMLNAVPGIVVVVVYRFLAPLLTGIIVAGRMGAAFTARIGTMKVSEEILAIETMAINPVRFLVVQRFLGMVIALPALTVLGSFMALFGSLLFCVSRFGMGPNVYIVSILDILTLTDVLSGIVKSLFYAVVIVMIGCYRGLIVEGSAEEVGKATMVTVVWSTLTIIVLDTVLTTAFYG
jgi:phospholipid/cholesterol/gamma-HCH transport system permease protein